jgi:hypothetical protein
MNIDPTFPGLVKTRKGYVFKGNIEASSLRVFVGPLFLDGSLLVEGDVSAQFGIEATGEVRSEGKIEAGHLKAHKITAMEIESDRGVHSKSDIVCDAISAGTIVSGGTIFAKRIFSKNHLCTSSLKCLGDVEALSIDIEKTVDVQGLIRTFWGFTSGSSVESGGFFSESIHVGGDLHSPGDLLVFNEINVSGRLSARRIFGGKSLSVGTILNAKEVHGFPNGMIRIGGTEATNIRDRDRSSSLKKLFSWTTDQEFRWEY